MTTIFQDILKLHDDDVMSDELNRIIITKLTPLLQVSFGGELPNPPYFDNTFTWSDNDNIDITYNFDYGVAIICASRSENVISVSLSYSDKLDVLYYKGIVHYLTVDHDLNFTGLTFNRVFEFSKSLWDKTKYSSVWGVFLLDTVIDESLNVVKKVSYQNESMYSDDETDIQDLKYHGLQPIFSIENKDFEELLIRTLTYCVRNSQNFYNVFPEYPSYIHCMQSLEQSVCFLNLFSEHYLNNLKLLKSKILLLDMQSI